MIPDLQLGPTCWTMGANLLLLLAAGWLILAPFALGAQPYTGGWTAVTTDDVWCGVLLVLAAVARLLLVGRSLARRVRAMTAPARPAARPPAAHRGASFGVVLGVLSAQAPFFLGLWLVVAPWVMQTQRSGAVWSPETTDNVVIGALVLGLAFVGVGATLLSAMRGVAGQDPMQALRYE